MSDGRDDRSESARDGDESPPAESDRDGYESPPAESDRDGDESPPAEQDQNGHDRPRGEPTGDGDNRLPGASAGTDRSVGTSDRQSPRTEARGPADGTAATDGPAAEERTAQSTAGLGHRRTDPAEYTTDRRSLSPRVQFHWGIRTAVGAVVLGIIATLVLRGFEQDPRFGGVLTAVLVILGTVWVVLQYRIWVYQIRDDAIYLERGVVTHVRTLVPYVRIQHVDTSRSPLERALGLSTLVVYTAGSRGADVSVPGLTPSEASDLQQRVKELAIEAEGDDAL